MELILKKDVENLGYTDDIVSVKNGYGRNFLIPQGKAILATISAKKALTEKLKQSANKDKSAIEEANKILKKLEKLEITITAKVIEADKLFGSVTNSDICKKLVEEGFEIEKNSIILSSNIKKTGKYTAKIRLHREVKSELSFEVVKDYGPNELLSIRFIKNKVRKVFISFGYSEIETPSIEKRVTLYEKYGDEGDKFIFNIINSGEKVKKADINALSAGKLNQFVSSISEKGLRFDLTVPLARFVAQHFNQINFPFKRFQIQKVWRSDRPQRGRFQEFTQCDVDAIGSDSLFLEYEMIQIYSRVFKELGLNDVKIKINHREILNSIADKIGLNKKFNEFIILIDKRDKIGSEKLRSLLKKDLKIKDSDIDYLFELFRYSGKFSDFISKLKSEFLDQKSRKAFDEINQIYEMIDGSDDLVEIEFDLSLARGLNYYTGFIFEVIYPDSSFGSLGGGGRYSDLTKSFGVDNLPGIGISFGLERIHLLMNEKNIFPNLKVISNDILIINFDINFINEIKYIIDSLRDLGRNVFVYPDSVKISKQFSFADKNKFNIVLIYGQVEKDAGNIKTRFLDTGQEQIYKLKNFIFEFSKM